MGFTALSGAFGKAYTRFDYVNKSRKYKDGSQGHGKSPIVCNKYPTASLTLRNALSPVCTLQTAKEAS